MQVKAKVLESQSGTSKSGRNYTIALVQVAGGRTGKIFSSVPLDAAVGKEVMLELSISPNREMFLTLGVDSVVAAK